VSAPLRYYDPRRVFLEAGGLPTMDRVTEAYLDEFSSTVGISHLPQDRRFEHFASYVAVRRHYSQTFDTSDIVTGAGGDTGIDAVVIIVNGSLVTDVEGFNEIAERTDYLDVLFIFVQAERSASFEAAKIGSFSFGIQDFFKQTPALPRNQEIIDAAEIMTAIYDNSPKFKRGNPHCRLYYITTGRWVGDATLDARRQAAVGDLESTNLFSRVDFHCFGADELQRLYRQSKNAISREFQFQNRVDIPETPGVTEAYLGHLPVSQFLSIIKDEDGDILQSIFYDNVRDWQGFNEVNNEIIQTLKSQNRNRFVIMNNGITIIARSMTHAGSRFTIEDFQIVNGCQTSHAIFAERDSLDESVTVPLRLISTEDEAVIESIIRATNRQTEVKREQFYAVREFAKNLEEYCQAFSDEYKFFYERRSRQFDRLAIEKTRIVTPSNMIRAFAAMFLDEPHRTTRSYARIADQVGSQIFAEGHRLESYYTAGFALYKLEYLF
jgi:hypothetical protein